jgi:hypothetical protein
MTVIAAVRCSDTGDQWMEGLDRGQRCSLRQELGAKHPSRMLEIQSGVPEIYRRMRLQALLLGRVLINRAC